MNVHVSIDMTHYREELVFSSTSRRHVADEFELGDRPYAEPRDVVIGDFVRMHVHRYAERLLESRGSSQPAG